MRAARLARRAQRDLVHYRRSKLGSRPMPAKVMAALPKDLKLEASHRGASNRLYTQWMGAKLSLVNRYLRNPELREKTVTKSVATSSAIEGIRAPFRRGAHSEANRKSLFIRKKP